MLGALQNARFDTGRVTLNPGDMLLAYSDGVTECRNARDEEFEIERLVAAAKSVTGMQATKALFSLLGAVLDFADSCSPGDDLTLLVVRRREATLRAQPRSGVKGFPFPNRRPAPGTRPKNVDRTG